MNIFIGENEDKDKVYDRLFNTLDTTKFKNEMGIVFKKANNNYVGYHLFKENKRLYKIFILPKHIKVPSETEGIESLQAIKEFVDYLKVYYKIKVNYQEYKSQSLNIKSSFDLAFESRQDNFCAQDIEQFIFMKYRIILQDILKFFDTYTSHKKVHTDYTSQTIKHKINLIKNIKEINKTKIHQQKSEDIVFSQIATLSYGVVKTFIKQKISLIQSESDKEILFRLATKLKNILQKKFNIEKGFDFSISKLFMFKNFKPFQKNQLTRQLYSNLLSLFGIEHFYDEKENKEFNHSIQCESFFIRPEELYEWIVYDRLKSQYENEYEVLKHKLNEETTKNYKINIVEQKSNPDIITKEQKSNPDIIMKKREDNSVVYIIDAKWKLLDGTKIPEMSDILKLKRDTEVRINDYKEVYSVLIYPEVREKLYQEYLTLNNECNFAFYSRKIGLKGNFNILKNITSQSIINY